MSDSHRDDNSTAPQTHQAVLEKIAWLTQDGCNITVATLPDHPNVDQNVKALLPLGLDLPTAQLGALNLSNASHLTDLAVARIRYGAPYLHSLDLSNCGRLTDESILHVSSLVSLRQLSLAGSSWIRDSSISILSTGCSNIVKLSLCDCKLLTDEAMDTLARSGPPSLEELDISRCTLLTDSTLKHLARAQTIQLSSLSVGGCLKMTDVGLIPYVSSAGHRMASFDLTNTGVTNAGVAILGQSCPAVREINLTRCRAVGDEAIILLALRCPSLRELVVAACEHLTDLTLHAIGSFATQMAVLNLVGCKLSEQGLLAVANGCSELTALYVDASSGITDSVITTIAQYCPKLKILQALGCSALGDEGLVALARHCRALKRVDVRGCDNVTVVGVGMCNKLSPDLELFA